MRLDAKREPLEQILQAIPNLTMHCHRADTALGSAVAAAALLLEATGGRLLVFSHVLPAQGPYKLQQRDDVRRRVHTTRPRAHSRRAAAAAPPEGGPPVGRGAAGGAAGGHARVPVPTRVPEPRARVPEPMPTRAREICARVCVRAGAPLRHRQGEGAARAARRPVGGAGEEAGGLAHLRKHLPLRVGLVRRRGVLGGALAADGRAALPVRPRDARAGTRDRALPLALSFPSRAFSHLLSPSLARATRPRSATCGAPSSRWRCGAT